MENSLPSPLRRKLLASGAAAAASTLLTGCLPSILVQPLPPCQTAPPVGGIAPPETGSALTIDAHAHVFNGTDLQIRAFLTENVDFENYPRVVLDVVADLLQDAAWDFAPTGAEELKALDKLAACGDRASVAARVNVYRENGYARARRAITSSKAFRDYQKGKVPGSGLSAHAADQRTETLRAFDQRLQATTYQQFKQQRPQAVAPRVLAQQNGCSTAGPTIDGMVDFIVQGFQYRIVSVYDYLATYNPADPPSGARTIDLMICNLVDYDWPLARGEKTRTPLRSQLDVMERIHTFTRGQVQTFVPFDPMRQVANLAGHASGDPFTFADIMDAVENRGFLGVKMYPPMGFMPLGNAAQPASTWQQTWLPAWMGAPVFYPGDGSTKSFGERLDDALRQLYAWAVLKGVPITAHAAESNGPSVVFEAMALAEGWQTALKAFPGLQINFGHIGDLSGNLSLTQTCPTPLTATAFLPLFGAVPPAEGSQAYADGSYFEGVLSDSSALEARLLALFQQAVPPSGTANLSTRLMYGSDWFFILQQENVQKYLALFTQVMQGIDSALPATPRVSDLFFGVNAVRWLGLGPAQPARKRLDDFYARNRIVPDWVKKVDSAGA